MQRIRVIFAGTLVLLLLLFSFNAYACVLPLFGVPQAAMGGSCADPQDEPVRQFCDAFTTLGLHAAPDVHYSVDAQLVSPAEAASETSLLTLSPSRPNCHGYPAQRPPQDAVVRTTVLRI